MRRAHQGDEGADGTMLVWNGVVARIPPLVARPTSAQEVAAAVRFAHDHGLLLDIDGSHSVTGTSLAERAVTLDLSGMGEIVIDPDARLAHVGPGCLPGAVARAAQKHRLATELGRPSDDLEELEFVTADGVVRIANRDENADLFWEFRRGAGDVGVVTRLTFRLREQADAH